MKRTRFLALAVLLAQPALLQAQQPAAAAPDYGTIKRQVELFETLLQKALDQKFARPFGILQDPKGTYLEGYGAVFSVEVNLYPMRWLSPFDPRPYSQKELREARERKLQRMRETETLVKDLLREHGVGLDFLRPEEHVAVVVHLFNTGDERDLPAQLIVQGQRQALLDAMGQKLSAAEFRQKLTAVTF